MTTQNYKQTILNAYRDRELSQADFADTVDHFEKLVRGEYHESDTPEEDANNFADSTLGMVDSLLSDDYKTGFKEGVQKYIESRCVIDLMINELSEEEPTDMKSKLKDGFTVVYRCETERTVKGDELLDGSGYGLSTVNNYNKQLININNATDNDIVSIRDTNNVEIWKRVDEVWVEVEQFSPRHEGFKPNFDAAKPPIGLLPKNLHTSNRIIEIAKAIINTKTKGFKVPSEWITELNELTK